MKKFLILLCVYLMCACNNTPQEQTKSKEIIQGVQQVDSISQTEGNKTDDREQKVKQEGKRDTTQKALSFEEQNKLNKQLIQACKQNNLERVQKLIAKGADVNQVVWRGDSEGEVTALDFAEAEEIEDILIKRGAKNGEGPTVPSLIKSEEIL